MQEKQNSMVMDADPHVRVHAKHAYTFCPHTYASWDGQE